MQRQEIIKRYALLIIGLLFSALGVAVTKRGELGVSPISSIPNVLSYKFPFLSMGSWLIVWNCVLIGAQIVMLRKRFRLIELLQIPVSLLFGYFTDLGTSCVAFLPVESYAARLAMVGAGTVILGFGIALTVVANVTMNPGEAVVRVVANQTKKNFGSVKIALDVSYVTFAVLLSLALFRLKVVGAREGTAIAAIFTGVVVKRFTRWIKPPLDRYLLAKKQRA